LGDHQPVERITMMMGQSGEPSKMTGADWQNFDACRLCFFPQ
jgi:hypothetical protein